MSYPPPYDPNQAQPPAYDPNQPSPPPWQPNQPPAYGTPAYGTPAYQPSPVQPPKKSKTGLIVGIILGVVLLLCAVCGVGGYYLFYKAGEAIEDLPNMIPSVGVATGDATGSHSVRYAVEGTGQALITYSEGPGKTQNETVTLPWTKNFTLNTDSFGLSVIAFRSPGGDANVTGCSISVDGTERQKRAGSGSSATCVSVFVGG
ncbi:MmpS family transport accessory protein [Catellatospora chokoriensis]|uniref:MmpS family membrane protein n=1 Tax=Catellatospora chokoriensis TaxID=310353 RepID=A0A8J3JZY0_9ACTN|nr:MmpS family transport accessory protein [Catellatospora chokoriensis]GIF90113.1 hypothetical protein Cch02nite_35570 [Catellatospora chokoriensis]